MSGVLADTSVWVRHFRRPVAELADLLLADQVLMHPMVLVEIACGTPPGPRGRTLADLRLLRRPRIATADEVLELIETRQLFDRGCGAVDMMLLAATLLTQGARLWTEDRSLAAQAGRLGLAYAPITS
jgi:predicted nucleic acid-binding protein